MIKSQYLILQHTSALALFLGALALPSIALAEAQGAVPSAGAWSMSTGVSFSRGDYGDVADTKVYSVPVSLKYRRDNWRFKVTLPWVSITGPGSLLQTPEGRDSGSGLQNVASGGSGSSSSGSGSSGSGSSGSDSSGSGGSGSSGSGGSGGTGSSSGSGGIIGGVVASTPTATNGRRSGLGDASASLTYSFDLGHDFYIDASGKLKIPTASKSKRLGSGRADLTASVDLIKDIGPTSLYVGGRRKFAGSPAGSAIRSVWGAGGGASVRASDKLTLGADYDWQESSFAGGQDSSEVTGWAYIRLNQTVGLTLFAGTGLNRASADVLGGATLNVRF